MRTAIPPVGPLGALFLMVSCGTLPESAAPPPLAPETDALRPRAQATAPPRDAGAASLEGTYTLTLEVDCGVIPADQRVRTYEATLVRGKHADEYVVTLAGATFLTGGICTGGSGRYLGIGCNQFFATEEGDEVRFSLENNNDEAHGGHIVERTSAGTWIEIIGESAGRLDRWPILTSGSGSLWYCPTPSGFPFPCPAFTYCQPTLLNFTLTPVVTAR